MVDRLITPGGEVISGELLEGSEVAVTLTLEETKRFRGSTGEGALNYWQNTVKSIVFGEPLNATFEGIYLGLNPSLEQLTVSYDIDKCSTQPVLTCSVEAESHLVKVKNSTDKKYRAIDYLLIQPGMTDENIQYSEAVDLLVNGVPDGKTKIIVKLGESKSDDSPIRVILKLTDISKIE